MMPPSKFQIMRINRGFGCYVNHKQQLLDKIDCCELDVLRTLRRDQKEEVYPAAEKVAAEMRDTPDQPLFVVRTAPAPRPVSDGPLAVVVHPEPTRSHGWFSRFFQWSIGMGDRP